MISFSQFLFEATRGTYVAVRYEKRSAIDLLAKCKSLGIPNLVDPDSLHTTLIYSTVTLNNFVPNESMKKSLQGVFVPDIFNTPSGKHVLVLKLTDPWFATRHKEIMNNHKEATYTHPEYIPHITVSYDVGGEFILPKEFTLDERPVMMGEYSETLK